MNWILAVTNVLLIILLVPVMYRRRHGRKDLVVSFMGANIGVFVVAQALVNVSSTASLGVGLGLFGVLSIIRLRSTELEQHDVAYFFSSLALGLLAGVGVGNVWVSAALMTLPVIVLSIVDHPRVMSGARRQRIVLDRAFTDHTELDAHLSDLLGADIVRFTVIQTDLVLDKTTVDVTFKLSSSPRPPRGKSLTSRPSLTNHSDTPANNDYVFGTPAGEERKASYAEHTKDNEPVMSAVSSS